MLGQENDNKTRVVLRFSPFLLVYARFSNVSASLWCYKSSMMACSCEKGRNNVSKGCMKKVRAWQNIDNDVAKCQAGIGGHSNGERH